MAKVGIVTDLFMVNHKEKDDHPERPDRIINIYKELLSSSFFKELIMIKSRQVTEDELLLAHTKNYLKDIKNKLQAPKKLRDSYMSDLNSVYANEYTYECAKIAAGSTLAITKKILKDYIDHGFAIVRPPGHHATKSKAMGFCFFNNVAIAALYARSLKKKVAIIDWDVHHGNGTEDIIKSKDDKDIYFVSIHRFEKDFYPGTGKKSADNIHNIPINPDNHMVIDEKLYIKIITEQIAPRLTELNPDIIIISCGFDGSTMDPLGGFSITPQGYYHMTKEIMKYSKKVLLVLEGGYNIDIIPKCAVKCVEALLSK